MRISIKSKANDIIIRRENDMFAHEIQIPLVNMIQFMNDNGYEVKRTSVIPREHFLSSESVASAIGEVNHFTDSEIAEYDLRQKIAHAELNGTIITEDGTPVLHRFLMDMFALALSKEDFLRKVNHGITDSQTCVSPINDEHILNWYDEFMDNAPKPQPKGRYFKGEKTLKALALDFVEINGPLTSTEIRKFMYETSNPGKTYDPVENRGWYSSYFSNASSWIANLPKARFSQPSKNDARILSKNDDGSYSVK